MNKTQTVKQKAGLRSEEKVSINLERLFLFIRLKFKEVCVQILSIKSMIGLTYKQLSYLSYTK